jgi:hypothetical protein
MTTTSISFVVDTTDPTAQIGFEAWIDNVKFFDTDHVDHGQTVTTDIDDADGEHELRFVMKNKRPEHTQINEAGEITADTFLTVDQVSFDEIELKQIFVDQAVYTHDYNGSGALTQDKFYGNMGCNGTITLKFSTPMYLWLLEHM